MRVTDTTIESRDTRIPVTLTVPGSDTPVPLVVMLHGHGGSRNEAGSFTQVAQGLASAGIASIRMDFPGCGDSIEPFRNQRLSTMLADAAAARDWAVNNTNIDTSRLAILGYSMGGRLGITLASQDARFQTLALWAPSADSGATALYDFFGGEANFKAMKARAIDTGWTPFTTSWGAKQELSEGWFTDMQNSRPLDLIAKFTGDLFVLYGSQDTVVSPQEADRVLSNAIKANSEQRYIVEGAGHGLGLFTDQPQFTKEAVSETVTFFTDQLR